MYKYIILTAHIRFVHDFVYFSPLGRTYACYKWIPCKSEESSVVPTPVSTFTYNKTSNEVVETTSTVYAKKVPLIDIRKKTLQKHEEMGILRISGSNSVGMRYLKIWHDHSSIAGHGHLLVLISVIYDSSFYLTTEAKKKTGKDIDVQSTVEIPEIHILGRSSSSIDDQSLFSACRNECLRELSTPLYLSTLCVSSMEMDRHSNSKLEILLLLCRLWRE